ncbi:MAG: ATP-binding protein [Acidobacteriota bacterium]|nr:ATP-binding protein [Acidobacteriota bacterium]
MDAQEQINFRVKVGTVFRPCAPVDRITLFAGRQDQINDVVNATVQPGRHVIMFGERGVGKTSLAKVLAEILSGAGLQLLNSGTINCDGTDNFASLWRKIFREMTVIMRAKQIGFRSESFDETRSLDSLLPEEPTPDDIRYILSQIPGTVIIILDEVDRIKDRETITLLADTIKNLSDHSVNVTLILVGVADAVDDLISEHRSIERALIQVPMPRMSRAELLQIIDRGLSHAGMTIDEHAKDRIARLSQGLPHYTHLLGLYAALHAIDKNQNTHITMSDVKAATITAVEKAHSILNAYYKATSSPQKHNLYEEVLLACALAETDDLGYFSAAAVAKPLSAIMDKPYYIPSFSRHLTDFCSGKRGPILQKTGKARRFRFRFINPLMQPFVIIHGLAKQLLDDELLWIATR